MNNNQIWLTVAGHRVALDLDSESDGLLPTFQANARDSPSTIQSDYSPEFSVPATAKNHRLLAHAAASQPTTGQAYKRVPAVLTSGGVETLPLATLLIKGYAEGRYNLQLIGGNRRLVEALVSALAPDETPAERTLLEVLQELTQTVDDQSGVVSAMHSTVSRLAPTRLASGAA